MRKRVVLLGLTMMLLGITSCSKNYTCTCSGVVNGQSYADAEVYRGTTRSTAKITCAQAQLNINSYEDISADVKCKLK